MSFTSIRYPTPLNVGDTIGVTAPSSGVTEPAWPRLDRVMWQLKEHGYEIVEGKCLRYDEKQVSAPAIDRASELTDFWLDPNIRAIIPPWGGELLIDLLPHLDFQRLAAVANPKWILGYSDTSTLLFALTTRTGIATAHGIGLMDMIWDQVDSVTPATLSALGRSRGDSFTQKSFAKYQTAYRCFIQDPSATWNVTEPVQWKCLDGSSAATFTGRLIGGCLDTLRNLVGTPFGDLTHFQHAARDHGVILYLENCDQPPLDVARALWQLKFAGWFDGLHGILLGRNNAEDAASPTDFSYLDALKSVLGNLNIPILQDADIGHRPPQMTMINGAVATVTMRDGQGTVTQHLI